MADNTPFGNINIEAGSTERSASWYQRQVRSYASHLNFRHRQRHHCRTGALTVRDLFGRATYV